MDAVVIAGGTPLDGEPLFPYTLGKPKALLNIAGKPMVQWVLDALSGSKQVERVVMIGLDENAALTCSKPISFFPSQGGMLENIVTGIKKVADEDPAKGHVLLVSSDIPGITAEIVDWVINNTNTTDHELYYHLIPKAVMEKRYPGSKRTYTKLKDAVVCGGDMNVVAVRAIYGNLDIWEKLIASRKNPLKQAAILGFYTLLLIALRAITVDKAVNKITGRLHMTGRAVFSPYAEIGMDVDKPHQLELMREDLNKASS